MKLADIDRVNHLVAELDDLKALIAMAARAETGAYQVVIDAPGDSSLHMSEEGASTTHSRGIAVSPGFLTNVKQIAIAELQARQQGILAELATLGVDTEP